MTGVVSVYALIGSCLFPSDKTGLVFKSISFLVVLGFLISAALAALEKAGRLNDVKSVAVVLLGITLVASPATFFISPQIVLLAVTLTSSFLVQMLMAYFQRKPKNHFGAFSRSMQLGRLLSSCSAEGLDWL